VGGQAREKGRWKKGVKRVWCAGTDVLSQGVGMEEEEARPERRNSAPGP
jgi:hypothetical protein